MRSEKTCSVDGCNSEVRARGMCARHYNQRQRNGELGEPIFNNPERSFSLRTRRDGECLLWTGATTNGYGVIIVNRKNMRAHRYAWVRENGPVPEGKVVDHICHNRLCVEVSHLRLATVSQNGMNRSGSHSKTGRRNVYETSVGTYAVSLRVDGKTVRCGNYRTIEEAARVAEAKRRELFGEYAGRATGTSTNARLGLNGKSS